jgi:hypothetical protein
VFFVAFVRFVAFVILWLLVLYVVKVAIATALGSKAFPSLLPRSPREYRRDGGALRVPAARRTQSAQGRR